ncbi:DUF1484 family protein [Cupriavidus nantongensis]|uniref:DUF1484 family protein n=1 Tax=Cupriavidus nantongensis TaxID=1796606 RepID=UPI00358E4F3F
MQQPSDRRRACNPDGRSWPIGAPASQDSFPLSKAVTLEEQILEAIDDILRVSAGLQSFLSLLDLQSDTIPQGIGLHALLLPLKQQLDESADRLQALV